MNELNRKLFFHNKNKMIRSESDPNVRWYRHKVNNRHQTENKNRRSK